MWLFRLELKRILKSRRTLILLAIALLLSVAMAYTAYNHCFRSFSCPPHDIIKSIIRSLVMSSTVSTNTPAKRIRYRITLSENRNATCAQSW